MAKSLGLVTRTTGPLTAMTTTRTANTSWLPQTSGTRKFQDCLGRTRQTGVKKSVNVCGSLVVGLIWEVCRRLALASLVLSTSEHQTFRRILKHLDCNESERQVPSLICRNSAVWWLQGLHTHLRIKTSGHVEMPSVEAFKCFLHDFEGSFTCLALSLKVYLRIKPESCRLQCSSFACVSQVQSPSVQQPAIEAIFNAHPK